MYSTKKLFLPVAESAYNSQNAQFGLIMSKLTVMQKTLLPVQVFDLFFGNFCGNCFFLLSFEKNTWKKLAFLGSSWTKKLIRFSIVAV